ncbi:Clavaminate synthase-like protein [Pleurostoma richardsiae]|uniref:Clavaminate synthase-like protein n=1 Tax=Pleurostoma richardsiae TaxID=41990 RepID=A0AA38RDL1_9PEZI|nr:Clavaminate synthase-like protein [Pleurostoma richardsiae]
MAQSVSFTEFTFDGQQSTRALGFGWDAPFPLALKAVSAQSATLGDYTSALKELSISGKLSQLVKRHGGAVLIRGIPITTPQDYSDAAHAFGFRAHEEVGRPPMRTVLAKNVKTANEGPPELPIWPHNEYGWSTINPAWLTFSALVTPESGGETPINSSIALAAEVKRQAPEFYDKLLKKGIRYVYRYGAEDVISTTGTSVFGAYGQHVLPTDDETTTRRKIEEEVRRHSNVFEWNDDGSLTVTHTVPLIRIHNDTGLASWFGNVTSAWGRSVHHGATEPPFRGDDDSYHPPPLYGDGEQIEKKYLDLALSIAESSQVLVEWEKGDLVLLDNYAVMHSRSPWKGQRQVLAALWDQDGRIGDYDEGKDILKASPRITVVVEG